MKFGNNVMKAIDVFMKSVIWEMRKVFLKLQKNELLINNEERLFKIEQEQKKIEEQLITKQVDDTPVLQTTQSPSVLTDFTPLYPIVPFGITTQFLPTQ